MKTTREAAMCDIKKWRGGVTYCPHCRYEPKTDNDWAWWLRRAHTVVLAVIWAKDRHVGAITECPECFGDSWMHAPLSGFSMRWPANVKRALTIEAKRREALPENARHG